MEDLKGKIRVYVRVRPFSQKEKTRGCTEAVDAQGKQTIVVQDPRNKEDKNFDFDQVGVPRHTAEAPQVGTNACNVRMWKFLKSEGLPRLVLNPPDSFPHGA